MLKVFGRRHEMGPHEWVQTCEILEGGEVVGFVEREFTPLAEVTRTRNRVGEVVEGERLDWLLHDEHA